MSTIFFISCYYFMIAFFTGPKKDLTILKIPIRDEGVKRFDPFVVKIPPSLADEASRIAFGIAKAGFYKNIDCGNTLLQALEVKE